LVGIWETAVPGGRRVWTINRDGSYDFRNESPTFAMPHNGTITARAGHWSVIATSGYSDSGTYRADFLPGAFVATGQFGSSAWHHPGAQSFVPGPPPGPGRGPAIGGRGGGIFNCNPCNGPIAK
jgi:hypothetical protein